jgi:hypothetical protein
MATAIQQKAKIMVLYVRHNNVLRLQREFKELFNTRRARKHSAVGQTVRGDRSVRDTS